MWRSLFGWSTLLEGDDFSWPFCAFIHSINTYEVFMVYHVVAACGRQDLNPLEAFNIIGETGVLQVCNE